MFDNPLKFVFLFYIQILARFILNVKHYFKLPSNRCQSCGQYSFVMYMNLTHGMICDACHDKKGE